jgi:hypothetical protein
MVVDPQTVDEASWHDNLVYALLFNVGDVAKGDRRSELVLDIDHIVEWICGTNGGARFRIAPATLTFHDVTDLRVSFDFGGSGHRQTLNELSIAAISQEPVPTPSVAQPYGRWRIELNLPRGGEITFGASGYTQTFRAEPVLLDDQRLPARGRPPLLLNGELDGEPIR